MSWKLKWAFLIAYTVRLSVNFSYFHLLFQNQRLITANFNHTWHKAPLAEGIPVCSDEGTCPFLRGIITNYSKQSLTNLKFLFSRTIEPISTKPSFKHPWGKCLKVLQIKDHFNSQIGDKADFFSSCYGIIIALRRFVNLLELFLRWAMSPMRLFLLVG